jgi:hypothetical protein
MNDLNLKFKLYILKYKLKNELDAPHKIYDIKTLLFNYTILCYAIFSIRFKLALKKCSPHHKFIKAVSISKKKFALFSSFGEK